MPQLSGSQRDRTWLKALCLVVNWLHAGSVRSWLLLYSTNCKFSESQLMVQWMCFVTTEEWWRTWVYQSQRWWRNTMQLTTMQFKKRLWLVFCKLGRKIQWWIWPICWWRLWRARGDTNCVGVLCGEVPKSWVSRPPQPTISSWWTLLEVGLPPNVEDELCIHQYHSSWGPSGFGYSGLASGTEQGHMDRLTIDVSTYIEVSIWTGRRSKRDQWKCSQSKL